MTYVVNWFGVTDDSTQVLIVERDPDATDYAQNGIYLSSLAELVCTQDPVEVSDNYARGWAISAEGSLRIFQVDGSAPAGSKGNGGYLTTSTGQLCVTMDAVDHYIAGVPVNVYGAVCVVGSTPPGPCDNPTVIFTQTFDGTGFAYLSQFDPGGGGTDLAKTYSRFSFGGGGIVTDLHWTGGVATPPAEPSITAWLIEFWDDVAGAPGALVQTAAFTPANANPVSIGVIGGALFYTYSVDIFPWFLADPGVTYWVSVQPRLVFPPSWAWGTATGVGTAYQVFGGVGASIPNLLAVDITGCIGTVTIDTRITGDGDTRITGDGDVRITG